MNDPNGLVDWNGRHHLFFQHNPDAPTFGNMSWGHASSVDFFRWEEHAVTLQSSPDEFPYDRDGRYSGCAVAVDGQVWFVYTGVEGDMQLPCLARASDPGLVDLARDPANPVIRSRPDGAERVTDFRDHSVRHEDGEWRQVVGGGRVGVGGTLFAYRSPDLHHWEYDGVLLDAGRADIPGTVWECPDVWRAGAEGVVVVSAVDPSTDGPAQPWWAIGELGARSFVPRLTARLDLGDRFYAPQSYWDGAGRRIMFGWLTTHHDPGSAGAESVGVMSVPRELAVRGGRLVQQPVAELEALRGRPTDTALSADAPATTVPLDGADAFELVLDGPAAAVDLAGDDGEHLTVDLGVLDPGPSARLLFDHGVVEVFADGRAASWSHLRLPSVKEAVVRHPQGGSGSARVWGLAV